MTGPSMAQTQPTPVEAHRAAPDPLEQDLARMRTIARLLDTQFEIAGIKFGWDAIVGLVPAAGDLVSGAVGLYAISLARKHDLGRSVQARMAANLLLDWAVGSVPVLGEIFDVAYKANVKNLRLLERAVEARRQRTTISPVRSSPP